MLSYCAKKTVYNNAPYLIDKVTMKNKSTPIYLMPILSESFDIIICMIRLSLHYVNILWYEKLVRLNLPNGETMVI